MSAWRGARLPTVAGAGKEQTDLAAPGGACRQAPVSGSDPADRGEGWAAAGAGSRAQGVGGGGCGAATCATAGGHQPAGSAAAAREGAWPEPRAKALAGPLIALKAPPPILLLRLLGASFDSFPQVPAHCPAHIPWKGTSRPGLGESACQRTGLSSIKKKGRGMRP